MVRSVHSSRPSSQCCSITASWGRSSRPVLANTCIGPFAIRGARSSARFGLSVTPSDSGLDAGTRVLVQLSAAIPAGDEATVRSWFLEAARDVPPLHVEELVLQSYLFCGFPRALNAAREWRRVSGRPAPASDEAEDVSHGEEWRERGEQ